jgi:myo-inositol-1-phosphate synthase
MRDKKVGVWLIGALGSISTTVMVGALAMRKGLVSSTGMVTASECFNGIDLIAVEDLEFGGCDIRKGTIRESANNLLWETRVLDPRVLGEIEEDFVHVQRAVKSGTSRNSGEAIQKLDAITARRKKPLREEIECLSRSIQSFKKENELGEVIVVNLASTEPPLDLQYCHYNLAAFERCLDQNEFESVRASTLYAYAAIREGCPYINFTPSNGALTPAMVELAERESVPVMGNDGKTGETLVKSALAPMFSYRNLEVLSWQGFNILGNMDGEILAHPQNKESKIRTKDQVLSRILGYSPHSKVSIDYTPSLDDQKTAWDFIHFRGFMGAKMSLQFVWQGYDSILAAPLVLDLIRLAEFAKRRGEAGLMPQLSSFFKAPIGVNEHRLSEQFRMLTNYLNNVRDVRQGLQLVNKKGDACR